MTTFDLAQIQEFVASLDARMGPALNGVRASQAALDAALATHAALCHEFTEKLREWKRAVFTGRIEFDPEVETVIRAEGARLAARAEDLYDRGAEREAIDPDPFAPRPPIARMNKLLTDWLRPQLAVGPGPRSWMHLTPEMIEVMRRQVAALPPLPADFPFTEDQRRRLGLK